MWGHPSLLLRDIAVNESDQQRVSDSGAIRSGLVPQLKHNAIHRRSPAWRTLLECTLALAEALQPPVAGECAILSPSSEDVTASMQDQRFLVLVGARRRMSRRAPTGAHAISPRSRATVRQRSRFIGCDAASCSDCLRADRHYLCTGDLLPGASATMLFNQITLVVASEQTALASRCSNYGFEMGVCRTWWKRVSYAQRDARAAQGAA